MQATPMDLSGRWQFKMDPNDRGIQEEWFSEDFADEVSLPGTMDENQKGYPNSLKVELTKENVKHLARYYHYEGAAWYQKYITIPSNWNDKQVSLMLERVLWESKVWIDDQYVGLQDSLSTPHRYDLSSYIKPGYRYKLTIRIDNSYKYDISDVWDMFGAHAYTEHTQTIWNGIIGKIQLYPRDKIRLKRIRTFPLVASNQIKVEVLLQNDNPEMRNITMNLKINHQGDEVAQKETSLTISKFESMHTYTISMPNDVILWDEFSPHLYELDVTIEENNRQNPQSDYKALTFGMRNIDKDQTQFTINGRKTFLRGTTESSVFPLTGYPPMEVAGWVKVFTIAKSYGFNHFRFHSWTPPKAAFIAADRTGFYLQIEAPLWKRNIGGLNTRKRDLFIEDEIIRILDEYGNHPSLTFVSLGNELDGTFATLRPLHPLIRSLKQKDNRHLYTTSTFSFINGKKPEKVDDYFITQYTNQGNEWIRGQGYFEHRRPTTAFDYRAEIEGITVPTISHEIGQYAVYPNMAEIPKYTGITRPLNFESIRQDLAQKGLLDQAQEFTQSSGSLAVTLYREEIEAAMRTPGMAGFQILDFRDFPGQSTATVGILDAFWDSKGLVKPGIFRRYNAAVVPLMRTEKFVYRHDESFNASIMIANFGTNRIENAEISWTLKTSSGESIGSGIFSGKTINIGNSNNDVGTIEVDLSSITSSSRLNLEVTLNDTKVQNDWNIWVYPEPSPVNSEGIIIVNKYDEQVENALAAGKKVLLLPSLDLESIPDSILGRIWQRGKQILFPKPVGIKKGISGSFLPVFWSPVHFETAGMMGIINDTTHPSLQGVLAEKYSNWHWWELLHNSVAMDFEDFPDDFRPIIQSVPNFFKNGMYGYMMEAQVEGGRLFVVTMDIEKNLENRPVARQLRSSILSYMKSESFYPNHQVDFATLRGLFGP